VIVTFDTSRWAHVCDTSVALGAPQRRAVEQVRTDHGLGIIHDLCVMRCLTVLFGQNYVTVTHWPLRGPGRTARQLVVQRTTDMVANAAVRTDSTRTLMFSRLGGEDRTALMFVGRSIAFSPVDTPRRLTASPPSATTATPD
jgi:hypothetical protein